MNESIYLSLSCCCHHCHLCWCQAPGSAFGIPTLRVVTSQGSSRHSLLGWDHGASSSMHWAVIGVSASLAYRCPGEFPLGCSPDPLSALLDSEYRGCYLIEEGKWYSQIWSGGQKKTGEENQRTDWRSYRTKRLSQDDWRLWKDQKEQEESQLCRRLVKDAV